MAAVDTREPPKRKRKLNGSKRDPIDEEAAAAGAADAFDQLKLRNAGKIDLTNIPPRQFVLGVRFCKNFISSTIGVGGVGKTALLLASAVAVATGKPITKERVWRREKVLYISLEDDDEEMNRRLQAILMYHEITQEELDGWLYIATPKGLRLMERGTGRDSKPVEGPLRAVLVAAIERLKPGLVILDPFIKSHGLTENDNTEIDIVMTSLAEIAQRPDYSCAIEVPHHMAKGGDPNSRSGRGASSFKDAARISNSLTAMTQEEASKLTLGEGNEVVPFLFRIDRAKTNIVPPATEATWFRLVNVGIGNGDETYPNGDRVQTVERWYPPDVAAEITDAQRDEILNTLEKGLPDGRRYSCSARAKEDRAAWLRIPGQVGHPFRFEAGH